MSLIVASHFHGKYIGVFGLGKSGKSVLRSLSNTAAIIFAWDDCSSVVESLKVSLPVCKYLHPDGWPWEHIDAVVVSPGIPIAHPYPHWIVTMTKDKSSSRDIHLMNDVQLFLDTLKLNASNSKLIGITGTNGKSTTTALINHVLRSNGINCELGGNFGIPVFDLKDGLDAYILEISSAQLELMSNFQIDGGVYLNLTPDHLDRHLTMELYSLQKEKLINSSKIAVIGQNCDTMKSIFARCAAKEKIAILKSDAIGDGIAIRDNIIYEHGRFLGKLKDLQINVKTNAENICATVAICRAVFNLEVDTILESMGTFGGLAHRNQIVGKLGNLIFVNDSKGTNGASTEKALTSWTNIHWILGGKLKDGGISNLLANSEYFFKTVKKAYLIGSSTPTFAKNLAGILPYEICWTLNTAFDLATCDALKGGTASTILLSPATASFDQFKNFEERGQAFTQLVENKLISSSSSD